MIAAATQANQSGFFDQLSAFFNNLPFGWFDVALVLILGFGLFRGRKNGMTKEVLPLFQWLLIVIVAGLGCEIVGQIFINFVKLDKTPSYVLGYLTLALVIYFIFVPVKKVLMPRLTGSNFFGSSEYYLGMISGMIRYACILLFALALLNAPYYTAADIANYNAYAARWFGGGEKGFSGDYFPTLQQVQAGVFKSSLAGRCIKDNLGVFLINSVPPEADKKTMPAKKQPVIQIGN